MIGKENIRKLIVKLICEENFSRDNDAYGICLHLEIFLANARNMNNLNMSDPGYIISKNISSA